MKCAILVLVSGSRGEEKEKVKKILGKGGLNCSTTKVFMEACARAAR